MPESIEIPRNEPDFHPFLPILLRLLAIVLFFVWGLTHLIYPEWYMVGLMGIKQYDPQSAYDLLATNLIGVLNIAFAITIWRIASDPVRFRVVIDMVLMVSIGTVAVFVFSIIQRHLSPREWVSAVMIAISVILLVILYPKPARDPSR